MNYKKIKQNINMIKPDLIYHLASNADVRKSFDEPMRIIDNNYKITINLLEAIRSSRINPLIIICSTSEVYGLVNKKDIPIKKARNLIQQVHMLYQKFIKIYLARFISKFINKK